jgi:plasmid replication initiation protein
MTRANRAFIDGQFDLFLPYLSDVPLRDQREVMERPFFSLAKTKRMKAIDYRSPDGKVWVHVSANPDYGMATIWDADILIYCASMISDMKRRGVNDVPRTLHVMPYDLLRAIGRPTTGRAYELLSQALDRLQSTTVKTNIRADGRREATFSWLDSWTQLVDEKTERSHGMSLSLAGWFWEGLMMEGGVLSIDSAYFDISGGRERWLYKVARKHAGGAGEIGFAISLPTLFEKSGAEGQYRRFKFEIAKIAEKNQIPGFTLRIEQGGGDGREPLLRMTRRKGEAPLPSPVTTTPPVRPTVEPAPARSAKAAPTPVPDEPSVDEPSVNAARLIRRTLVGLSTKATAGYLTDETLATLRAECPGWDYQTLHHQFREWIDGDPERTPVNYQNAFIGFVRSYDAKNRHQLGR